VGHTRLGELENPVYHGPAGPLRREGEELVISRPSSSISSYPKQDLQANHVD
jgi:hypothetical protein